MAVTHDMIAVKLGINRTTVTKALKDDHTINIKTRKKVLETATLMGYDFKQSQKNRREGKRYYAHEVLEFRLASVSKPDEDLCVGEGSLTNLSSTGLHLQVTGVDRPSAPLQPLLIKIRLVNPEYQDIVIPTARVVRITFYNHIEVAGRFADGKLMDEGILRSMELSSFRRMDQAKQVEA